MYEKDSQDSSHDHLNYNTMKQNLGAADATSSQDLTPRRGRGGSSMRVNKQDQLDALNS